MKGSLLLALILMLLSCGMAPISKKPTPVEGKNALALNDTFVHVVYFWLKNPIDQSDRQTFEESLKKFLNISVYAKTKFLGTPPRATRSVVDDSYTYSLILSFDSAEDQQAYQMETAHTQFIQEAAHLWERVLVYDAKKI